MTSKEIDNLLTKLHNIIEDRYTASNDKIDRMTAVIEEEMKKNETQKLKKKGVPS